VGWGLGFVVVGVMLVLFHFACLVCCLFVGFSVVYCMWKWLMIDLSFRL